MKFYCPNNSDYYLRHRGLDIRFTDGYYETDDPAEIKALRKAPGVEEAEDYAGSFASGGIVPTVERSTRIYSAEDVAAAAGEVVIELPDPSPYADLTRPELDEVARGNGLDPTQYRYKADLIAALEYEGA